MTLLNKVLSAALVLTVGLLTGTANASTLQQIVDASFKLYKDGRPTCSGTFVNTPKGEQVFLTAAHCVINLDAPYYNTKPEGEFTISKISLDDNLRPSVEHVYHLDIPMASNDQYYIFQPYDIALLKLRNSVVRLPVTDVLTNEKADTFATIGTEIAVVGFPLGMDVTFNKGLFTEKERSSKEPIKGIVYRFTAPVTFGNSGGGMYALTAPNNYEYMGVVSHLVDGTRGQGIPMGFLNYAIPVNKVNEILGYVDMFGFKKDE